MKPGDHHEALDRCDLCADTTLHEYTLIYVETLHEALTRCGVPLYGPATMRTRTWERRCMGCKSRREKAGRPR
jgi:hypothetical protein